tara:strand:- start:931 stop:1095 length:165 start_codon:yes stop_codon:yes gene_type:complete
MKEFRWYRKWRGGTWYKHSFTLAANELGLPTGGTWWVRYGKINRYSMVIDTETH